MTDGPMTGPTTDEAPPAQKPQRAARPWRIATLTAVLAIALATAYWLDIRQRLSGTQQEVAARLRAAEESARLAASVARAAQDSILASQARIAGVEARLAESQSQQLALEALYQDLSRN